MAPLPGLHEILRAAAPTERAGVPGVAVLDAALGRRDAGVQRVEDRVLEPLPRQLREEPLHGVHPRRRGRREVERPVGMARRHGQRPPRAAQRLYLRLLVHREHDGVVGRIDIKADNVADPDLEPRVARDLEASWSPAPILATVRFFNPGIHPGPGRRTG